MTIFDPPEKLHFSRYPIEFDKSPKSMNLYKSAFLGFSISTVFLQKSMFIPNTQKWGFSILGIFIDFCGFIDILGFWEILDFWILSKIGYFWTIVKRIIFPILGYPEKPRFWTLFWDPRKCTFLRSWYSWIWTPPDPLYS